tara:strand:- start:1004 stop:1396 length:393 start_codon:yes stop_codon:yes gene_type:complete
MQLKKSQLNSNITLTLTEKTTITTPVYLFRFESDQTKQSYYCISPDLATESQKVRFNLFNITEGVNDPLNGSLVLGLQGRYHFYIYEQSSTTNLDPTGLDIVERGIMTLKGDQASPYRSYESNITYKVYE